MGRREGKGREEKRTEPGKNMIEMISQQSSNQRGGGGSCVLSVRGMMRRMQCVRENQFSQLTLSLGSTETSLVKTCHEYYLLHYYEKEREDDRYTTDE